MPRLQRYLHSLMRWVLVLWHCYVSYIYICPRRFSPSPSLGSCAHSPSFTPCAVRWFLEARQCSQADAYCLVRCHFTDLRGMEGTSFGGHAGVGAVGLRESEGGLTSAAMCSAVMVQLVYCCRRTAQNRRSEKGMQYKGCYLTPTLICKNNIAFPETEMACLGHLYM